MIRVTKIQIPSLPTEKPRRLYVYLPREYGRTDKRYPVLYMFDGHNVFYDSHATYGKSWGMKEYLERTKLPLILVGIECNPEGFRRLNEYSPWDFKGTGLGSMEGLGRVTMDWITKELKPAIDAEYRTLPDREHTMIAGSSMGGLMSLYAAVEYNEVFSKAAALSPCFWVSPKRMNDMIRSKRLLDGTMIYMDYGAAEDDSAETDIKAMFNTAKLLTLSGASVAARAVPGAKHSEAYWEKRIPVFFDYLLGE
ncbi:MAG: alpha/beta hydrolase [Clostridiales bacterium]|nr:alpha/beta hydrolase [Clostridiales bacterium]